jgi:hypothetical protein
MPTKDGFNPDDCLHRFLTNEPLLLADEPERQGIANEADQQLFLRASILVAIAAAISIAISSVGSLGTPFADATASVVDKSALQPGTDPLAPTVQSTADAKALPPTAKDDPPTAKDAPSERAAATELAGRNQPESSVPSSEALFREFQAWTAEKDAEAQVHPVQQPVQDAAAKAAGNARASPRLAQKQSHVRAVHNAQAKEQSTQNPFLQIFGRRN